MGTTRADTDLNESSGFMVSEDGDLNHVLVNIYNKDYKYTIDGNAGSPSKSLSTTSQPYFPMGANSVNVSGHYPYFELSNGKYDFTVESDQTSTGNYLQSDLMTANRTTATRELKNGSWEVTDAELLFKHQLTKIVIDAESEDEDVMIVKSATINNVKPTVEVSCTDGVYAIGEAKGNGANVKVLNSNGKGAAVIPPQSFVGTESTPLSFVTINVDYRENPQDLSSSSWKNANLTFSFTNTKSFLANIVYTMHIVVGMDQIRFDKGNIDISGWDTGDNIIWITPTVTKAGLASLGKIELSSSINKVYKGSPHELSTGQSSSEDADIKVWARANLQTDNYDIFLKESKDDGKTGDYVLTYVNNIHADDNNPTATVKVIGINDYSGFIEAKFQIKSKSINDSHVTIDPVGDMVYDGGDKMPEVKIYDDESGIKQELHINTDYTLDYASDVVNCGEKSFTIKGIGNYNGTRSSVPTYNITKSSNGSCIFDVSDQTKRYYLPSGTQETYTPVITTLEGDDESDLTITMSSSDESIAKAEGSGKITIMSGGDDGAEATVTITIKVEGKNYTYPEQSFTLKVKSGPRLPIMYVADTNMGTATALAENNWSSSSSFFSWRPGYQDGYVPDNIGSACLTSYHVPLYEEWQGIIPSGDLVSFAKAVSSSSDQSDANVVFGYNKQNNTWASNGLTSNWKSDYYTDTKGRTFALRFKGTAYCCAYRYELLQTSESNMWLTGNTYGKYSLVIQVIYLGKNNKLNGTVMTASSLAELTETQWNENSDFSISLPICGANYAGCEAGQFAYDLEPDYGHYITSTITSGDNHYYLLIDYNNAKYNPNATFGYRYGINLRPFKNN